MDKFTEGLTNIENRIFNIRGVQGMVDRDLGELYQVDTKVLNQAENGILIGLRFNIDFN
jgi:hypothetical protein